MKTQKRRRNSYRLAGHDYADPNFLYFITLNAKIKTLTPDSPVNPRTPFTSCPALGDQAVASLHFYRQQGKWFIFAYCLMPDHLHLLVSPRDGANLSDVLGHYKSYVTRIAWQHGVMGPLWERSFYDQIVRNEKAVSRVVAYILNNPVKAKLVESEDDWPWSGTPDSLATHRGLSGDHGGAPRPRPYRLINQIQPYAWGARGAAAFIPRLLGIPAEPGLPYAELWIGAHPKAPSEVVVKGERVPLDRLIAAHPREILGETVAAAFGGRLPFLFKVLSAAEALSIQVHPNKAQAVALHARDPAHYPDANHKPELAIALDSLTLLAGFKPFTELVATLEAAPALAEFTGEAAARLQAAQRPTPAEAAELVGALYAALLRRSLTEPDALAAAVNRHARQLREAVRPLCEIKERFLALREKYGDDDVGLFSLFLLNLVHLQRGEAIFTPAGVPHAYLEGNLIECMANSDNVVRAGLTPKFRDIETLVEILAPAPGRPAILRPSPDAQETVYRAPAPEFEVSRWELRSGQSRRVTTSGGPEVYLVTQGSLRLRWGAHGETATFGQGESFLAPAVMGAFEMLAQAHTEIFRVVVPS